MQDGASKEGSEDLSLLQGLALFLSGAQHVSCADGILSAVWCVIGSALVGE